MPQTRNPKADLWAIGLSGCTLFLALALGSYDRADSTGLVYPPRDKVFNLCGRAGAYVADLLFQGLGLGAYYLVASLTVLSVVLLARRPITEPVLRLTGWLLSLAGWATFAAMAL